MNGHEKRTAQRYAEEMMDAIERAKESPRLADRRGHFNAAMTAFRGYLKAKDEEHRATLSSARDAALTEAAADLIKRAEAAEEFGHTKEGEVWRNAALAVRALKSRPAERYLSEAEVREVLLRAHTAEDVGPPAYDEGWGDGANARDLGVDLDAAPKPRTCARMNDSRGCASECRGATNSPGVGCVAPITRNDVHDND